jgi:hypothetical protein
MCYCVFDDLGERIVRKTNGGRKNKAIYPRRVANAVAQHA